MIEPPIDPRWRPLRTLLPSIGPAISHGGWFASFLLLAPVIGPRGYGLFIFALSGVALMEVLFAAPMLRAIEAAPAPDDEYWSTALVTTMVLGTMLSGIVFWSSGIIGAVVGEDGFCEIVRSLSPLPLLGMLAVLPRSALRRANRNIAAIGAEVAGLAAGGGIALALAWSGAGTWSLVAQIIVRRLVECAALWLLPNRQIGIAWSWPHFIQLLRHIGRAAITSAAPRVTRYVVILIVGWGLGPTAAGLYMLAARLSEAVHDVFLPVEASPNPRDAIRQATRLVLPSLLGCALLVIAVTPVIDLRWWGALLPAQILLLGGLPAAAGFARRAWEGENEWGWQLAGALGSLVTAALVARHGLAAIAAAQSGWMLIIAFAGLAPMERTFKGGSSALLAEITRPIAGAAASGFLVYSLAEPVGLILPPVPALCLLTTSGWLLYLVIRGDAAPARPLSPIGLAPPLSRS